MRCCLTPGSFRSVFYSAVAVGCMSWAGMVRADAPSTAPTTAPMDMNALSSDLQTAGKQLNHLLPEKAISDAAKRQAVAGEAIPLLKRISADFDGIVAARPEIGPRVASKQQEVRAMLVVLGDKPTIDQLQSMADSADPKQSLNAKGTQLLARWYGAGDDVTAQTAVADQVEKLDRANPADNGLTVLTFDMSLSSTAALKDRLRTLATDGMTSVAAASIKKQLAHQAESDAAMNKLLDKPMTIAGKQPDGSDFTTADWKGKVVLVDFWATWCGPCKAELPRVKQIYKEYHPQGLELVSVSNDYDVEQLKSFVKQQDMPWPELFDADAASEHSWSGITLGLGIDSIPRMFLIDRKGIVRDVMAREDMENVVPKLLAEGK